MGKAATYENEEVIEKVIRKTWNVPQSEFMRITPEQARYVDFEGAVRAGKSTPLIWKLIEYAMNYPGIQMMLCRWTDDALKQLVALFYAECPKELLGDWNSKDECQPFTNGSLLFIRSLKTSDDNARYVKFSGLTLAVIALDQPEEVPVDVYEALKARLSQPGYPQQLLLTPNPPAPNHWLTLEFPEDNTRPGYKMIHTTVYDNRRILGEQYILALEQAYPPGHAMRRRWIEGKRGLTAKGEPVYGKIFFRDEHVAEIEYLPDHPLIESWDFGQKHPAVSWHQLLPWGWWNILAEYQGTSEFIDITVPTVSQLRASLFPKIKKLLVCCDPSGADSTSHGMRQTAVTILNDHLREKYGADTAAQFISGSNKPEKREYSVQQIAGYMTRLVRGRTALKVHPRCGIIIDGFEGGYVYDDRSTQTSRLPSLRRPKKDGYYDHLQNTNEYVALNFTAGVPLTESITQLAGQNLRIAQYDEDESFRWDENRSSRRWNRTGY